MNFYNLDKQKSLKYADSIAIISSLSRLFSDNSAPFLHYRIMENIFCKCFKAKNLSRSDTSYDAQIGTLGIGLKTFICEKNASIEKIAEFNKDYASLKNLNNESLARKLAELRNDRIESANRTYGINTATYHIIARRENELLFFESDYEKINIDKIKIPKSKQNKQTSLSFNDEKNEYIFNFSKSVLQRKFYIPKPKDYSSLEIQIAQDPFKLLLYLQNEILNAPQAKARVAGVDYVVLPLYSTKSGYKEVPQRSGLNQWRAGGRGRKWGEVYIPVPRQIHKNAPNFFPPRDMSFNLQTPNGEVLSAKICQDGDKALMSNPNTALAKWILQTALGLGENKTATYQRMENLGFDSVIVSKESNGHYSIDIMPLGSYERFISTLR